MSEARTDVITNIQPMLGEKDGFLPPPLIFLVTLKIPIMVKTRDGKHLLIGVCRNKKVLTEISTSLKE